MKACLSYACQVNILHQQEKSEQRTGVHMNPVNTKTHKRSLSSTSSHCMGQNGSLKVSGWSLLFFFGCLLVVYALFWDPANRAIMSLWMRASLVYTSQGLHRYIIPPVRANAAGGIKGAKHFKIIQDLQMYQLESHHCHFFLTQNVNESVFSF